jgi:hypothetical protein
MISKQKENGFCSLSRRQHHSTDNYRTDTERSRFAKVEILEPFDRIENFFSKNEPAGSIPHNLQIFGPCSLRLHRFSLDLCLLYIS